jgi:tetratricopeptide (TPR) repeat protein
MTIGQIYATLNQKDKAQLYFSRIPKSSRFSVAAKSRLESKNHRTSKPEELPPLYIQAQNLLRAGNYDQAITILRSFYRNPGPLQTRAGNDLAWVLANHYPERLEEARRIAVTLIDHGQTTPELLDTLGWIEYLQGNYRQSLFHLNQAIMNLQSSPEARKLLRIVYEKLGNHQWADYYSDSKVDRS